MSPDISAQTFSDRNFVLDVVRVTEAGALAAAAWMGRGDETAAEQAAAIAMRDALNLLVMDGTLVNGETDDPEQLLHAGERVGTGTGPRVDIALTAIEGATICAKGSHNALSVVAATQEGAFLHVPSGVYMEKIAVGPGLPPGTVELDRDPEDNLAKVAAAKGVRISDLTVCLLDRPRHGDLLVRIHQAGARAVLIDDGDVSGAIATGLPETGLDLYMGSGGAAQGVLAAAALKCLGGQMQCRLIARSEAERTRILKAGISDPHRIFAIDDMIRSEVMFAATGITDGHLMGGLRLKPGGAESHSLVMRSASGTIRKMTAFHDFSKNPDLYPR